MSLREDLEFGKLSWLNIVLVCLYAGNLGSPSYTGQCDLQWRILRAGFVHDKMARPIFYEINVEKRLTPCAVRMRWLPPYKHRLEIR